MQVTSLGRTMELHRRSNPPSGHFKSAESRYKAYLSCLRRLRSYICKRHSDLVGARLRNAASPDELEPFDNASGSTIISALPIATNFVPSGEMAASKIR